VLPRCQSFTSTGTARPARSVLAASADELRPEAAGARFFFARWLLTGSCSQPRSGWVLDAGAFALPGTRSFWRVDGRAARSDLAERQRARSQRSAGGMDLTRGSGISPASAFLAGEMMSDAEPLLSLRATPANPQAVTPSAITGAFELRREGGGCAWRAELAEHAAEFAAFPDQRARVPDERVSE